MTLRGSKVELSDVPNTLQNTAHVTPTPNSIEHAASPSSPPLSGGSPARSSFQSHSRTMSVATDTSNSTAPRTNRFSLSFPVQPSGSMSPVRMAQSPTREASPIAPESRPSSTGPTDTNFLTAIAAQERRVLELKEELVKAEGDLNNLKRQWQQHEAQKKRNDARSVTKLQPLHTSLASEDKEVDVDGSNAWMQQEMERRKALLNGSRPSNRRVFSGSKHTRTLSLLSPGSMGPPAAPSIQRPPRPPRKDSLPQSARRSQETEAPKLRPPPITRASTTPDLTVDGTRTPDPLAELAEASAEAGKKVATGLRDGLWTFWEDLRQATVGDEATQIPPPRHQSSTQTLRSAKKQSSKTSLRPSSRGSSTGKGSTDTKKTSPVRKHTKSKTLSMGSAPALADPSFWTEHGVQSQQATPALAKRFAKNSPHAKSPSKAASVDSTDEAWDAWDDGSPQSRSSSAISDSTTLPSTVSGATSPRMSAEVNENGTAKKEKRSPQTGAKKDPIPWPALSNLGPKALRRTASHLMSEWEKSLTPSPSKEYRDQGDYMGLGAEAAAASVPAERKMA